MRLRLIGNVIRAALIVGVLWVLVSPFLSKMLGWDDDGNSFWASVFSSRKEEVADGRFDPGTGDESQQRKRKTPIDAGSGGEESALPLGHRNEKTAVADAFRYFDRDGSGNFEGTEVEEVLALAARETGDDRAMILVMLVAKMTRCANNGLNAREHMAMHANRMDEYFGKSFDSWQGLVNHHANDYLKVRPQRDFFMIGCPTFELIGPNTYKVHLTLWYNVYQQPSGTWAKGLHLKEYKIRKRTQYDPSWSIEQAAARGRFDYWEIYSEEITGAVRGVDFERVYVTKVSTGELYDTNCNYRSEPSTKGKLLGSAQNNETVIYWPVVAEGSSNWFLMMRTKDKTTGFMSRTMLERLQNRVGQLSRDGTWETF